MRQPSNLTLKIVFISLLLFPVQLIGQPVNMDTLNNRVLEQLVLFPQEKIYVHTDKPYYIVGENIWFRAHIVNASVHQSSVLSRYVYGELISPTDTIVNRVKIKLDSLGYFHGYFNLREDLPEGDYQLRFYTRFLENVGEDYFFTKKIKIGDPLSALYSTKTSFTFDDKKKNLNVELRFIRNNNKQLIYPENVKIRYDSNLLEPKVNTDSIVRIVIKEKPVSKYLYVEYDYDAKIHKQFIPFINLNPDFDVTFHPEGGDLIKGVFCKVAFKALNSNGYGEDIAGIVVSEAGDTLSRFESLHKGMGYFQIHSDGKKYFAICKNNDGLEKKFEIPVAKNNTLALNTIWIKDNLRIATYKSSDFQVSDSLYLFVQSCGILYSVLNWDVNKGIVQFNKHDLPSGVIQLILTDGNYTPISERLVFNYNEEDVASSSFSTDKPVYGNRELVRTSIRLTDYEGNALTGDFSFSVTDDNVVVQDTTTNIGYYLLLQSDIKGYIEDPSFYFKKDVSTITLLDILMMTQGWRRYNFTNVMKAEFEKPLIPEENSFTISGLIKGLLTTVKEGTVILLDLKHANSYRTTTDENGKFKFDNFELPDSTQIVIQGWTKRGGPNIELTLNEDIFPKISGLPMSPASLSSSETIETSETSETSEDSRIFKHYIEMADKQFVIENGMRTVYLKPVEVVAQRIEKPKSMWASFMNTVVRMDDWPSVPSNMNFALSMIPGISLNSSGNVAIRGRQPLLVIIDDIEYEPDPRDPNFIKNLLGDITPDNVDEIVVMKDYEATIFGSRGQNGVIIITTKSGADIKPREKFNIKTITPLGYQVSKEFYAPKYETAEQKNSSKSDFRTTIHWAPYVITNENGEAEVDFYTADSKTIYSVVYEGVTSEGMPISGKGKIVVE